MIAIEHWTVNDVGEWLQSMMLSQYVEVFTANQISGPVLLDISLEDLDYMEVKALGHRKVYYLFIYLTIYLFFISQYFSN